MDGRSHDTRFAKKAVSLAIPNVLALQAERPLVVLRFTLVAKMTGLTGSHHV